MSEIGKLLINESPLTVLPSLVKLVGLERAIILQQVHYACQQPRSGVILDDGKKYVWNTYQDWKENYFPFWEADTIRKHFAKLESENLIISCQPKKQDWDRTKYYRVNYEQLNVRLEAEDNAASEAASDGRIDAEDNAGSNKEAKTSSNIERGARARKINSRYSSVPVNSESDAIIEEYLKPLRNFLGVEMLPDEYRWANAVIQAVESRIPSEQFTRAYKTLLSPTRNFPITPENVLSSALQKRVSVKTENASPRPAAAGGSPYVSTDTLKEMELEFLAELQAKQVQRNGN